ncbi:MAG: helix-turn-helix domain-containing protein [Polyangiaceae bacterium]|nr:helix-turn-helix domain-containing protein [Polyangiaceae bacterium]
MSSNYGSPHSGSTVRTCTLAPSAVPRHNPPLPASWADHPTLEKERIWRALHHGWNRLRAAQALGIPRRTFYRRLREFSI